MNLHRNESGQAIILVALAVPCLVAIIGLAVDAGALFNDRREIQTAADAAAMAGALNLTNGTYVAAGKAASAANGFTDGSSGATVNVVNGPTWASSNYHGHAGYIEATVTKVESTIFMAAFGYPSVTVTARAVATNQAPGNGCVYLLGNDPTTPDLSVQGNVTINAPDCSWNINDTYSNAINTTGGSFLVSSSDIGVAAATLTGSRLTTPYFQPAPVSGVIPFSDPLQAQEYPFQCTSSGCTCNSSDPTYGGNCATNPDTNMPTGANSCTTPTIVHNGITTLQPGCYYGFTVGSQDTVVLNGGVYFFTGSTPINFQAGGTMEITATVSPVAGDPSSMVSPAGVTLIFTGQTSITMNGNPTLKLSPPDSTGVFPNMLIYQVPSDTQTTYLGGTSSSTVTGVIYAPTATESFQGTPGGNFWTDFVTKNLTLAGNASFNSYAALPGGSSGLNAVALVE